MLLRESRRGGRRIDHCETKPRTINQVNEERQEHAGGAPELGAADGRLEPVVWFDFDEIDNRLGWTEPDETMTKDETMKQAGEAFASVLEWIGADGSKTARGSQARAAVVQYMVRPETFSSQVELARELGVSKQYVNHLVCQFRDRFGFRNALNRSDAARGRMRESYVKRGVKQ